MEISDGEEDKVKPGCCFPLGCGEKSMRRKNGKKSIIGFRVSRKLENTPLISDISPQKLAKTASYGSPKPDIVGGNPELVVCLGDISVDFITSISGISLAQIPAFKKAGGGAAATVAVGISRLGGTSAFIGKVGDDQFGHMLADILKQDSVDDVGLRFDPNEKTKITFITLTADGKHETMFFHSPDMPLSATELDKNLVKKSRIFHYGSTGIIKEPSKSVHLAAIEMAKRSGSILSYAPNLRLPICPPDDDTRQGIMSLWNQADIIKVSREEATFLAGDDNVLEKLYHPNLKLLIVTDGDNGCSYYTKEFKGKVPTLRVDPIDPTGAGDAFVAALLASLAKDPTLYRDEKKVREVIFFGNSCSTLSVMQKGAIPSLPTREQVHQFLNTR